MAWRLEYIRDRLDAGRKTLTYTGIPGEEPGLRANGSGTFSKSRCPDMVSAQAIIQVTAKAPLVDFTTEIMIGRGNKAYIYLDHLCPSDPLELAYLQDA
jgi:hypothetical protein